MTVTLEVELYGSGNPPAVLVTVQGLADDDVAEFNVYRQVSGEAAMPVRGGVNMVPRGNVALLVDVAAPLGRPVSYWVEYWVESSGVSAQLSADPITVPFAPDGIAHHVVTDAITGRSMLVALLADEDTRTNTANAVALTPAGAAYPVILYDVRAADTGALTLYTRNRAETQQLVDLLAAGRPIASRHAHDGCDVASVEYLYPTEVARSRRTRTGDRTWTMSVLAVDIPDPALVPVLVTLGDLAAYYTGQTLADLAGDFTSLLELARFDFGVI